MEDELFLEREENDGSHVVGIRLSGDDGWDWTEFVQDASGISEVDGGRYFDYRSAYELAEDLGYSMSDGWREMDPSDGWDFFDEAGY